MVRVYNRVRVFNITCLSVLRVRVRIRIRIRVRVRVRIRVQNLMRLSVCDVDVVLTG